MGPTQVQAENDETSPSGGCAVATLYTYGATHSNPHVGGPREQQTMGKLYMQPGIRGWVLTCLR